MTTSAIEAPPQKLKRALGLPGLVLFGLTYLAPVTVFTTYGLVTSITENHLPAAYLVALIAMLFTASSYGKMARAFPVAGSAYTYTQQTFGGGLGFLAGWTLMLDYLFLPMVNFMLIGLYANTQLPDVPAWVFLLGALLLTLVLNVVGITLVNRVNIVIVTVSVLLAVVFVALSLNYLGANPSSAGLIEPFLPGGGLGAVFSGAAILALSFLGFDAVSTMSEEARNPRRDIPRAILLTTLIGGAIFIVVAWVGALVFPDWQSFTSVDTAGVEVMARVGGQIFTTIFVAVYIVGAFGSGMATQISVTRIIYAMGRDGVLPRILGRLSIRFRTPVVAAVVVSLISCLGFFLALGDVFNMISFGALFAFSIVNLAVVKHFLFPRGGRISPAHLRDWITFGVLPLIGFALTIWLWTSLVPSAFAVGLMWMGAGIIVLAIMTRGFTRKAPIMDFSEAEIPAENTR